MQGSPRTRQLGASLSSTRLSVVCGHKVVVALRQHHRTPRAQRARHARWQHRLRRRRRRPLLCRRYLAPQASCEELAAAHSAHLRRGRGAGVCVSCVGIGCCISCAGIGCAHCLALHAADARWVALHTNCLTLRRKGPTHPPTTPPPTLQLQASCRARPRCGWWSARPTLPASTLSCRRSAPTMW